MCNLCDWEVALDLADDLSVDPDCEFAIDTIEGIREWIEENEHVTSKQLEALENIQASIEE